MGKWFRQKDACVLLPLRSVFCSVKHRSGLREHHLSWSACRLPFHNLRRFSIQIDWPKRLSDEYDHSNGRSESKKLHEGSWSHISLIVADPGYSSVLIFVRISKKIAESLCPPVGLLSWQEIDASRKQLGGRSPSSPFPWEGREVGLSIMLSLTFCSKEPMARVFEPRDPRLHRTWAPFWASSTLRRDCLEA